MHDAYSLASTILADHYSTPSIDSGLLKSDPDGGLPEELTNATRNGKIVVDIPAWQKIDRAERNRVSNERKAKGKEREKFTKVEDMLAVV